MKKTIFSTTILSLAVASSFSTPVIAQDRSIDVASGMEIQNSDTQGNQGDIQELNEELINPFRGNSETVEDIQRKRRIAEEKLELIEQELEIERKMSEKELLPYQKEIQRQNLFKQLHEAQKASTPEPEVPRVTEKDIENRIDEVAGRVIEEKDEKINQLSQQIVQQDKARNTFNLKLVARDGDELFAIISNSNGDHKVYSGDEVSGWKVMAISQDSNTVLVKKGSRKEIVKPSSSSVSTISYYGGSMGGESGNGSGSSSNGERMPNPDLIPPPNFSN